ncbi:MAG: peptide/nickel transport system substrate-binding protein [Gammaproteobacteria bacterium]|jgi:peptide/nickel transport system substrate-binding protein
MVDIKNLEKDARDGKLDRREFMKRAAAIGLAAPFATTLLSQSVHAGMANKGGRFVQGTGHGSTTDTLDPGAHENGFMQNVVFTYGNHLFEVDNNGQLIPELAESFDASKDAKTWVIKLRQGVEFHNGKTMTADDVISSINHHRGEDSKSAGKSLLSAVETMKKTGKFEVTFNLSAGNADFPFILSDYHFAIFPDFKGEMDWQAGFGTGGYIIERFEPGVRATFKRNPNYFKADRAHFDEVETIALIDTTARQNAVMNGEVHAINRVDPKTVHLLGRVGSLKILETTGTLHYTFPMRVDQAPFDNYDLRMAVKLATDREQLVQKILLGHGAVGNDHPISTSNPYHNGEMAQRTYDPDKARFHLKKAKMEGVTLDLGTSEAAFSGAVDAALLLKDSAAKAGLDINVVREPKDGYWSNVWNKKAWSACYWGGRPTEDWMFSAAYVNDSKWNDTAWTKGAAADRFNKLVIAARSELDTTKRREMYYECQTLVSDDGGSLIPMFANNIHAVSKKIGHDEKVAGNWEFDGNKSAERWWFV